MSFGGGTKVVEKAAPVAAKAVEKPARVAQEEASSLRARRRRPTTSLLSPERENAMQGLSRKLSGGE